MKPQKMHKKSADNFFIRGCISDQN